MEDEYHVLFECPTYHHIRLKYLKFLFVCLFYEEALFSNFGGVSRAARSMRPSGKVSAFMNQNPRKVAAFVSECLDYTNYQLPDGPVKAGRRWGQRHPQGANLGSNGILKFLSKLKQWLPPAHPKSLASQCMSGQPISTCHALTS